MSMNQLLNLFAVLINEMQVLCRLKFQIIIMTIKGPNLGLKKSDTMSISMASFEIFSFHYILKLQTIKVL